MRTAYDIVASGMIVLGLMTAGGDGNGFPWVNFCGFFVFAIGTLILPKDNNDRKGC